jgi:energy-coupling factor transporter ATP-binding protein EcfA2
VSICYDIGKGRGVDNMTDLAKNLIDAYDVCEVAPLQGKDLDRFYLPLLEARSSEAIVQVEQILKQQQAEKFATILFTGHRGCGKSTELHRIEEKCKNDYLTVFLDAIDETDINDLEYIDLYLAVIRRVELALRQVDIKFDRQLLQSVETWFKEITKETEETVAISIDTEAEASLSGEVPFLAKLLFKLKGQIKNGTSQKTIVREKLIREVSRMKSDINLLLGDGLRKLRKKFPHYKGFLVIVDNLENCPIEISHKLFFDYASQLQELHCTIVYTVPISILYSPRGLNAAFGDPHIVPMVNIYQLDRGKYPLAYNPKGLDAVAEIIAKRVDINAIFASRNELLELVKASGGHVRQLIQLMQRACLTAQGRNHDRIQIDDVDYAIKQLQFSFERSTPKKYFTELANIALTKEIQDDEIGQQMLFSSAVLEYNGSDRWNYPNPLLMRSNAFNRAINSPQSP